MAQISRRTLAIGAGVVVLLLAAYIYLMVFGPGGQKPFVPKPSLEEGQAIEPGQVTWLANEIGSYKLHAGITGEKPEFEAIVDGAPFNVTIEDGKTAVQPGKAANPDIRITADQRTFARIYAAQNATETIAQVYKEGLIGLELLKDQTTLALKGYKSLYDALAQP